MMGIDIFMSYAREDRERAERLGRALRAQGWSVWWDRDLRVGGRFNADIEAALAAARCIVVVWSSASIRKDWVIDEAGRGRDRGILIPVLVDPVGLPLGFGGLQTADLVGWSGQDADVRFQRFLAHVGEFLHGRTPPRPPGSGPAVVPDLSGAVALTVSFPGKWSFDNPEIEVRLDKRLIGGGTLKQGFNVDANTYPGDHTLELAMSGGILGFSDLTKKGNITFNLDETGRYRLEVGIGGPRNRWSMSKLVKC